MIHTQTLVKLVCRQESIFFNYFGTFIYSQSEEHLLCIVFFKSQAAITGKHAGCARLLLETAALSQADSIIVNHEDHSATREAPLHTAGIHFFTLLNPHPHCRHVVKLIKAILQVWSCF